MCYAKPGPRCEDKSCTRSNDAAAALSSAQADLDSLKAQPNASKALISKMSKKIANLSVKAAKLREAYEETQAGINELRADAAAAETKAEREELTARADRNQEKLDRFKNGLTASNNRERKVIDSLQALGVPTKRLEDFDRLPADATVGDLNVKDSTRTQKALAAAEERLAAAERPAADVKKDAWKSYNEGRDTPVTAAEFQATDEYAAVMDAYRAEKIAARDGVYEARAAYYSSPRGLKELTAARNAARAKVAARRSLIAEIEEGDLDSDPRFREHLDKNLAAAEVAQDKIERSEEYCRISSAIAATNDPSLRANLKERRAAMLRTVSPAFVRETVRNQILSSNALGDPAVIEAEEREAAVLDNQVRTYTSVKKRAAGNKTRRQARERMIREMVAEAGKDPAEAERIIKNYRKDRKDFNPYRQGRDRDPAFVQSTSAMAYYVDDEVAEIRKVAEAKGMTLKQYCRARAEADPRETFFHGQELEQIHANAPRSSDGQANRQRTREESTRKPAAFSTSPHYNARISAKAEAFMTTRSSYLRAMTLSETKFKVDLRQIANDISGRNNSRKVAVMAAKHDTPEHSAQNTPGRAA